MFARLLSIPMLLAVSGPIIAQTGGKADSAKPITTSVNILVGTWVMTSTSYAKIRWVSKTETTKESVTIQCNVCPKITFNADGTGFTKNSNDSTSHNNFTWKLFKNKLLLTNSRASKATFLASGTYNLMRSTKTLSLSDITLVDSKNTKHVLTQTD